MDDPRDTRPVVPTGHGQVLQFPKPGAVRGSGEPAAKGAKNAAGLSNAELFALLWRALADVLGTAAAATLLRRAAQRTAQAWPELAALAITREAMEYQYQVPSSWNEPAPQASQALCALVRELWLLLVELTGPVVVARLLQVSELRDRGIVPPREQ